MQDAMPGPITPLTARSVALNALLGARPPALPVRSLVRIGARFGIAERTTRVALTRMVADGDLATDQGVYRLTDRLMRRHAQLDEVRRPTTTAWDGTWLMAVVTAPARPQAERVALRRTMLGARMGELREGVWMRPRNVVRTAADDPAAAEVCRFFTVADADAALVDELWDLAGWGARARHLRAGLDEPGLALVDRFLLASRTLRHLVADPLLPPELRPPDWPADELRERYLEFERDAAEEIRGPGDIPRRSARPGDIPRRSARPGDIPRRSARPGES